MPPRPSRRVAVIAVNVGLFAGLLAAAELGARVFAPRDLGELFNDPQVFIRKRPFVVAHPTRGFALLPGYKQGAYTIDSAGFRGVELPADRADTDLAFTLGESSTFGWGVGDAETYPAHLQAILAGRPLPRPWLVVNAGVPSYTSPQVLAYLRELLPRYRPATVLVSVLWNDALFACLPNWLPDYLRIQQPAAWRQWLLRHSALYRAFVIRQPTGPAAGPVRNEAALRFYADNLTAMVRECRQARARIYFLAPSVDHAHIPPEGMKIWRRTISPAAFTTLLDEFTRTMESVAAREQVPVVHHRLSHSDPALSGYFNDPVHLNGQGNRLLAEDVAGQIFPAAGGNPGANGP